MWGDPQRGRRGAQGEAKVQVSMKQRTPDEQEFAR